MKCINLSKWDIIELSEYQFICSANKDYSVQAKGFVFVGDSCTWVHIMISQKTLCRTWNKTTSFINTQLQKSPMKCINLSKWDVKELSEYQFICSANKDCSVQAKGFVFVGDSCTWVHIMISQKTLCRTWNKTTSFINTQLRKSPMKCINLSKWDVIELSEYQFICSANKDCSLQAKGFVFVGDSCTWVHIMISQKTLCRAWNKTTSFVNSITKELM